MFRSYTKSAYWFYEQMLARALEGQAAKKLIIITDGGLGHIPFEAFLSEPVQADYPTATYASLPFLLKDYQISYHYSAALWLESEQEASSQSFKEILAFAPHYHQKEQSENDRPLHLTELRKQLIDLPAAQEEVKTLSQYFEGLFLFGEDANESQFKALAGDYSILHLAMHGILNKNYPILSSLAFTENSDTIEDNFLQAYEISHMDLQADLVVLSACETGYGKFEQGEGVVSLARSFMYAGVPSVVVSLWQVSDFSTAHIMQTFYRELSNGKPKDEALQTAKLTYINSVGAKDALIHPAFWAPFIQLGNSHPIPIYNKNAYWWWAAGLIAVLFVGGGLFWRRKSLA